MTILGGSSPLTESREWMGVRVTWSLEAGCRDVCPQAVCAGWVYVCVEKAPPETDITLGLGFLFIHPNINPCPYGNAILLVFYRTLSTA